MYLKGYNIKINGNNQRTQNLPKWDFGVDKPWTISIWNKILNSLKELKHSSYPLIVSDLDQVDQKELILNNKSEFEEWLKSAFK